MRSNLLRKTWSLVVIVLLVGTGIISATSNTVLMNNLWFDGNMLYVGGSGPGNYSSIQKAIDNASDGDTIFVFDDSSPYYEHVVVEKSITLLGEDRETTIIDGGESLTIVTVIADGVTISGITVQNSGILWINSGIEIRSSYNTISGNIILNNCYGIRLSYAMSSDNIISDNTIMSNNGAGVFLFKSFNNMISMNTFSDNLGGLILDSSNYNNVSDNVFFNDGIWIFGLQQNTNTVSNNLVNGKPLIYLEGESDIVIDEDAGQMILVSCDNITIQNQELSDTSVGILLEDTDNCLITGNTMSSNDVSGVFLGHSSGNNISMNTISNNPRGIIFFDTCDNNIILWNTISLNKKHGIWLSSSNNNTISRNAIKNNGGLRRIHDGYGLYLEHSSYNKVYCNNFILNAWSASFYDCSHNNWNGNYWNRPRFLPKLILGVNPFVNFDWHPAREPYEY